MPFKRDQPCGVCGEVIDPGMILSNWHDGGSGEGYVASCDNSDTCFMHPRCSGIQARTWKKPEVCPNCETPWGQSIMRSNPYNLQAEKQYKEAVRHQTESPERCKEEREYSQSTIGKSWDPVAYKQFQEKMQLKYHP